MKFSKIINMTVIVILTIAACMILFGGNGEQKINKAHAEEDVYNAYDRFTYKTYQRANTPSYITVIHDNENNITIYDIYTSDARGTTSHPDYELKRPKNYTGG